MFLPCPRISLIWTTILLAGSSTNGELLHKLFDFEWEIVGDYAVFQVAAQTRGWVGLGLNEKPLMKDACIVVAGVLDGRSYGYDTHGVGHSQPHLDQTQNYELLAANENTTHTSLTIRRRLDTGDTFDTVIGNDPIYILWAFGDEDARNGTSFDYHAHRGYTLFNLLGQATQQDFPAVSIPSPTISTTSENPTPIANNDD